MCLPIALVLHHCKARMGIANQAVTPGRTTLLEAVNVCLQSVGEQPVNTLENQQIVEALMAERTILEFHKEGQTRGWSWNSEQGYEFSKGANSQIAVPASVVSWATDAYEWAGRFQLRGQLVYDLENHTYTLEDDITALRADVVWLLPWNDCPEVFNRWVTVRAVRVFSGRVLGNTNVFRYTQVDEQSAWVALLRTEASQAQANSITGGPGMKPFPTFSPGTGLLGRAQGFAGSGGSAGAQVFSLPPADLLVTQDNYLALSLGNLMDAYKPKNTEWAYYKLERNVSDEFDNYAAGVNMGTFLFKKRNGITLANLNGTNQYFKTDPLSTSQAFIGYNGTADNTVGLWVWFDALPASNKFLWIASNSGQTVYTGLRFNATSKRLEYIRYSQGLFNVAVVSGSQIQANRLYTTICRYDGLIGRQELFIDRELEGSTVSPSPLVMADGELNTVTVGVSENEGFTAVNVGRFRLARLWLDDIQRLMSVPVPEIFFGTTVIGNEWVVIFNDETLGFTVPPGLAKKNHTVYVKINGASNTPIVASYIDLPVRSTALSVTFNSESALDLHFNKMYQQWGGENGGVVPQNVSIGADSEGVQALILECHGDYYTGPVQGVNKQRQPKFNNDGTPWVKRVGAVVVSKNYFCFGRYEYVSKVVQVLGVASAFWHFHYQEIYPDDPRWDSYRNDLGLRVSGDSVNGHYIVRNNEIDIELPSHLLGGDIEDPSLSNGKFNTWRGELQNYDVAPGAAGYWEEYRDNYRALGFNAADGQYHVYRYDWYHDRVEFYIDNVLIVTNINNQFGYDSNNIPDVAGKVTIGPWFPSAAKKWAGPFANFAVEKMYVRSFSYTPFPAEIANHQVFLGETYVLV